MVISNLVDCDANGGTISEQDCIQRSQGCCSSYGKCDPHSNASIPVAQDKIEDITVNIKPNMMSTNTVASGPSQATSSVAYGKLSQGSRAVYQTNPVM